MPGGAKPGGVPGGAKKAAQRAETIALPQLRIKDQPQFAYRGMHLDVSRHFFPAPFIKRYIDLLALHKMNVFHWHLTDDQGWRLESKAFPRLTSIGAWRAGTVQGHTSDAGAESDGIRYGGYYTMEEVRDIVAYAARRHITVVPEIDVPGHAAAMLAAYPELGCTGEAPAVQTHFGIFPHVLCPRENTFAFMETLLAEVAALFPGPYIHIGGDEVRKEQWMQCAECRELMAREGLEDYGELHAWFVNRMEAIVAGLGRRMIGWDDILEGEIRPAAVVMSWRGMEGGIRAAGAGHDVIMTPLQHAYFDFYQSASTDEPLAIHGLTRLQDVYAFSPLPPVLSPADRHRVLGGQGNLWTEYVRDAAAAERMVLPRMSALAEVLWTPPARQRFEDFAARLPAFEKWLRALGYRPADSHYKPHIEAEARADGGFTARLSSLSRELLYTLDGSPPEEGRLYAGPFRIKGSAAIRAVARRPDGSLLGDARLSLARHLARGAVVVDIAAADAGADGAGSGSADGAGSESADASDGRYAALVDGRLATDRIFQYPEWVGFAPDGARLELRLPAPAAVQHISIGIAPAHHRRLARPTAMRLSGLTEGGKWKPLGEMNREAIAAAGNRLELAFPPRQITALRLELANDQTLWSPEQAAALPPTLYLDEIIVR